MVRRLCVNAFVSWRTQKRNVIEKCTEEFSKEKEKLFACSIKSIPFTLHVTFRDVNVTKCIRYVYRII